MRRIVLLFAMLVLPGIAQAQIPTPAVPLTVLCPFWDETLGSAIDHAVRSVSQVEGTVEGVPPKEWDFLQAEREAARDPINFARLQLLEKHPYFQAFELRDSAVQLRRWLGDAKSARTLKGQLKPLYDVMRWAPLFDAAFDRYVEVDRQRTAPVVSKEAMARATGELWTATVLTPRLLGCVIGHIPGDP